MTATQIVVLVAVVLVLAVAAALAWRAARRARLRRTFGPEYDRAVADAGSRTEAERELRERERRHSRLELRPLSARSRATYAAAWEEVQVQFVDAPDRAVATADELVTRLIAERGYPTGDYGDQLAGLSVDHARTLDRYRAAHAVGERLPSGGVGTEELRQAMVDYRALFAELLGTDPVRTPAGDATADGAAPGDAPPDRTTRDTGGAGPAGTPHR